MENLEIIPLLGGISIGIVSGALGCLVVWRNMAYFADSLTHSALLGAALGMILGYSPYVFIVVFCIGFALLLAYSKHQKNLSTDSWLGILSFSTMSAGLIILSLVTGTATQDPHQISAQTPMSMHSHLVETEKIETEQAANFEHLDLEFFLFGNILDIQWDSLLWICIGSLSIMVLLITHWPSIVLMSVDEELAQAEGVPVFRLQVLSMLMLALFIAFAVRLVGVLLVAALLILPAAAARQWATTPTGMLILACCIAAFTVFLSFILAAFLPIPIGPTAVLLTTCVLVLGLLPLRK